MTNTSNPFGTLVDYMLALLHLMDEVKQISLKDAIKEFDRRYQDSIPLKERTRDTKKGREKWNLRVEWARNDLVALDLMGSAGRGIWTITEKGQAWIHAHPNDRERLLELDRQYRYNSRREDDRDQLNSTKVEGEPVTPMASSSPWKLTDRDYKNFFERFETLLPQKLQAFCSHAKISVVAKQKYVQIKYPEFSRSQYELRMGHNSDDFEFRFEALYFQENISRLEQSREFADSWNAHLNSNLAFNKWGKKKAKISFALDEKLNMIFWSILLSGSDFIEGLGNLKANGKTSAAIQKAAIKMPSAQFWEIKAEAYAALMSEFINVTFQDLKAIYPSPSPANLTKPVVRSSTGKNENARLLLDKLLLQIRHFLEGRSVASPSHEVLCDWIQLCYLFGLFEEGYKLSHYVNELELNNDWLYRRTKKYAGICRLNAARSAAPHQ